jgi:hypothetical protein
LGFK